MFLYFTGGGFRKDNCRQADVRALLLRLLARPPFLPPGPLPAGCPGVTFSGRGSFPFPRPAGPASLPRPLFLLSVATWVNSTQREKETTAVFWHLVQTAFFHPIFLLINSYLKPPILKTMYHIQSHEKGTQQALNYQHAYSDYLLRNLSRRTADGFTNSFLGNTESSILVTSETRRSCSSPHTRRRRK